MPATPLHEIVPQGAGVFCDWYGRSADACKVVEVVTVEDESIFGRLFQFSDWNVHFADEERVAQAVEDLFGGDAVSPVDGFSVDAVRSAGDDDTGSVATVVEVGGESG